MFTDVSSAAWSPDVPSSGLVTSILGSEYFLANNEKVLPVAVQDCGNLEDDSTL